MDVRADAVSLFVRPSLFWFSFFLVGMVPLSARAAFGISPPFLNADHLVPGARYVQTIYLVQDQPIEDLRIKAILNISDRVRPWVSIDKGFDFVIPKDTRQFPVHVAIQIPSDAGLGVYSGSLTFTGAPSQTGQVTIALGAQVAINLTVGNDIFRKFTVPVVKPLDIEEGWNPRVYVKFQNEGNIPESFSGATYDLMDQYGVARLAFSQTPKGLVETPPFSIKEYVVEFPVDFHLGLGQYWGLVTFYQDNKAITSQKMVFNVLKKGTLSSPSAQLIQSIKDGWMYYVGGVLVLLLFAFFGRKRKTWRFLT